MRSSTLAGLALGGWLLFPSLALAQDTAIAGVVKDASGAVVPGVTVEASSPALIERVRVALTDGSGKYKIINLVPGSYVVTFTLEGFTTYRREGIELSDGFTAPVNADLRVGNLAETVTVSATAPVVDVQSLSQSTVMTREVMDAIPTGRNVQAVGILIPGTALQIGGGAALSRDVGGSGNMQQSPLSYRGSNASVTTVDGLRMNDLEGSGQYADLFNDGSFQEVSYTTGADSAEMGQGGLRINMVPKEGGNTFRGTLFGNWTGKAWQADNCRAPAVGEPCTVSALKGRGITSVSVVHKIYDFNPSFGGPVLRDRLWFQGTFRSQGVDKTVVDSFYDKNPDPIKYEADLTRPGVDDGWALNGAIRLTGQITPRNKLTWYFDRSNRERAHWGISATTSPEASGRQTLPMEFTETVKYQSTLSNRLLLELGFGEYRQDYTDLYQKEVCLASFEVEPSDPRSCKNSKIYRISDQITGKNCCAYSGETLHYATLFTYSAKLSYVTGSHQVSGGWTGSRGPRHTINSHTGELTMRFGPNAQANADASGFGPNRVTLILPTDELEGITMDSGFWVQDKWTVRRATITAGLRYDWFVGYIGKSSIMDSPWLAAHTFDGPEWERTVPNWRDLSPRLGVAYDIFGNGKTAVKVSLSRYVDAQTAGFASNLNPVNRLSGSINLDWTDANGDYTIFNPDGSVQDINFNSHAPIDPATGLPQNELSAIAANSTFGTLITSTTRVDPAIEAGFGRRGYTWEIDAGVQHELLPRVAVGVSYFRRLLGGNATTTDNVNQGPASYVGPFCITGPNDPRLPDHGGAEYCGIYQRTPASFSVTQDNLQTFRSNFLDELGLKERNYLHGADISIRARIKGAIVQGGASIARTVNDTCYNKLLDSPQSIISPFSNRESCFDPPPFQPDVKLLASYELPWQLRLSGTFQHTPGPLQSATWTFNQAVAQHYGFTLAGNAATPVASTTSSIDLLQGKKQYDKPLNQLDVRLGRRFIAGKYRLDVTADLYNVFNRAWVFSESGGFGSSTMVGGVPTFVPSAAWLRPTNILNARMFKMGAQLDF